jgi:sortase A
MLSRKLKKYLSYVFLLAGFALLTFSGIAKLRSILLSRVALRQFEAARDDTPDDRRTPVPPTAAIPNFVLWSQNRIQQYEESIKRKIAPPLAVIRISRIDVEAPVLEGTDDLTLNRGVGHIAGTALFGQNENVGIAGHRDGFFRNLKNVRIGDHIEVEESDRVETYIVDRLQIVTPKNVSALRPDGRATLTLVTCYPFYYVGPAPRRFIVHAALIASEVRAKADVLADDRASD